MNKNIKFMTLLKTNNKYQNKLKIKKKNKILSAEEERKLTKKWYYNNDIEAAKKLITINLNFVINVARNYNGYGIAESDLIQEGNIGLIKAIKRFNPEVGVRLISFAIYWIKAEIHEYILRNWRIIKVATTKTQRKLFFNIRKNKKHIGLFKENEINKLSKILNVTKKDIREMEIRMSTKDTTFDIETETKKNIKKTNLTLLPTLYIQEKFSNFNNIIEEEQTINNNKKKKIMLALKKLDKRSQDIIKQRWLNSDNKSTLKTLANKYNISAERIRQLEKKAIKKMRIMIRKYITKKYQIKNNILI